MYEYEVGEEKCQCEIFSRNLPRETCTIYCDRTGHAIKMPVDTDAVIPLVFILMMGFALSSFKILFVPLSGLLPIFYFMRTERWFKGMQHTVEARRATHHTLEEMHYATYEYTVGEEEFTYYFRSKKNSPPQELTLYYKKRKPRNAWSDIADSTPRTNEKLWAYVWTILGVLVIPLVV